MAETTLPCINLIIPGFVASLSTGGLFMAGLAPAALIIVGPPLGLGLYGACLIGGAPIEVTAKPMLAYLSLLLACLLVIAFVPGLAMWLPHAMGY